MEKKHSFHFIGMGGVGMSALAEIMLARGYRVSGSDMESNPLLVRLGELGAEVFIGHHATHLGDADRVVCSSAIGTENPELEAARSRGLTIIPRGQMLARLMDSYKGITVAGTHGKTTTTAMIAGVMLRARLDPTLAIGARIESLGGNARCGKGEWFVAESDESDRSFLALSPFCAVVTNIDRDHMEEYGTLADLQNAFLEHMNSVSEPGFIVACGDDPNLEPLLKKLHRPVITYGLSEGVDLCARKLDLDWLRSSYDCYHSNRFLGRITLNVSGLYNVLNSLAAAAVGLRVAQARFDVVRDALRDFRGPDRRLQEKGERDGVWVIDDYGHHPAEVRSTLRACRLSGRRTVVVFQPHRYTRTQYLMKELSECFEDADILFLMDIYPAGEDAIAGINSEQLAGRIGKHRGVRYVPDRRELLRALRKETATGDLVLTLGAGDVWKIGEEFLEHEQ